ncbi:hypothetical protein [Amycolatopsis sp. NPDC057786]|uniref:hypothetical protein n=1 Tax=Amycolatopsis sp. NPDC057786 TaxID=3346250 RepID=UPI003671D7DE
MTPPNWPHGTMPNGSHPQAHHEYVASGNSTVGQQIGVNYGSTTFHRHENTYHVSREDPPERKLEVAKNHLEGGNARMAQEIFRDVMKQGQISSAEFAYYYALAVFSGRSLGEMNDDVHDAFLDAIALAGGLGPGEWHSALEVVSDFVTCVWGQQIGSTFDPQAMNRALKNFSDLPPQRQREITRHLNMILSGAIQDSLDVLYAQRVAEDRLAQDRAGRAWKFFEPDPAPPRFWENAPSPVGAGAWVKLVSGMFALLLGLLFAIAAFVDGSLLLGLLGLLLVGAGTFGAFRWGLEIEVVKRRLVSKNREHGIPVQHVRPVSPGHWVSTRFVEEVHGLVDLSFAEARPHIAGNWDADTFGIRQYLKTRFVALYGNAQVGPESILWLMRWHARQVADQWRAGTLFAYRASLRPSGRTSTLFKSSVGGCVVGSLFLLFAGGGFAGVAFFLGLGAFLAVKGAIQILAPQRDEVLERAAAQVTYEAEQRAYSDWRQVLSDRPSDAEMARWLDLDKNYLKTEALRRSSLVNRDLVAHVVLTEGMSDALRARVPRGPLRYSKYVVLVFLLTKSGVREIEVQLNFLTGDVHNEQRKSFRYDALASAHVAEVGIRFADNRRYVVRGDDPAHLGAVTVRSREFRLSLLSGEDISVLVEGTGGLTDMTVEDESEILQTSLTASGIAGALHVLEAVAAEGRDWIVREQERRRRRSQDWRAGSRQIDLLEEGDLSSLGFDDESGSEDRDF